MENTDTKLVHRELSGSIIGASMEVLRELRPGLDEKLYENALVMELESRGHRVEQQRSFPVLYKRKPVGLLIPDMIVDKKVVVDSKVVTEFNDHHVSQMLGYLAITELRLALLVNFKYRDLRWKRVLRPLGTSKDSTSAESVQSEV